MKFITIYVTYQNQTEAKKITSALFKDKLIACATFLPVKSQYCWQGKIIKTNEVASWLTAKATNWAKIKSTIEKMHSYQVPCIKKEKFLANKEYENWINEVTTK